MDNATAAILASTVAGEPTVTVRDPLLGDRLMTREEFVREWSRHVKQIGCLAHTDTDWKDYFAIERMTKALADREFDRLLEAQKGA